MKAKSRKCLLVSGVLLILFIVLTLLVSFVDVQAIGPNGSTIGLAGINNGVFQALQTNDTWYKISDLLGKLALAVAAGFGVLGLYQLIRRKSLRRIDSELWALYAFYVLVLLLYAAFEFIVINYRPILVDGQLEASYPSSHTMLAVCIFWTAPMQLRRLIRNKPLRGSLGIACIVLSLVTIAGRMLSGVHWFSDVLGGILLGAALVNLYASVNWRIRQVRANARKRARASGKAQRA